MAAYFDRFSIHDLLSVILYLRTPFKPGNALYIHHAQQAIKRRVRAMQGFRSFHSAWQTLQGIDTMKMIRKGQVRWLPKDDIAGQIAFISSLFGLAFVA